MKTKRFESVTRSLQFILILSFVSIIIITVVVISVLNFQNAKQVINDISTQETNQIFTNIESHLENFLLIPHQININNDAVINQNLLDYHNQKEMQKYFFKQIKLYKSVTSIYFGNIDGGLVGCGRENSTEQYYYTGTENFKEGLFQKYMINENGEIQDIAAQIPDFNCRTRSWYKRAVEKKKSVWSDLYILFTGQDIAVAASRPVYDDQKNLIGVLSIDLFLSDISNFLNSLAIGKTGDSFIIERSGLMIASSTDESPFVDTAGNNEKSRIQAVDSQIPVIKYGSEYLIKEFGNYYNITKKQQLKLKINSKWYFLLVSPIQDNYGIDWLSVIILPESDFLYSFEENNLLTTILTLIALVISIIICIFLANRITKPVRRLNNSTKNLLNGDWHKIDDYSGINEISELTQSFNTMGKHLDNTLKNLHTEISERIKIEEDLIVEREFINTALNSITDTVFVFDVNTGFPVRWNRVFTQISGYTNEEIAGMAAPVSWYKPEDIEKINTLTDRILAGEHVTAELSLITKSGNLVPTEYSTAAIRDKDGEVKYIIAVGRDVRERKQIEEHLRRAQKLETLGNLVGGLAHDMNNVLAGIVTPLSILELKLEKNEKIEDHDLRKIIEYINDSTVRATNIVKQFLTISKRQELALEPIDLISSIRSILKICKNTFDKSIEILFDYNSDSAMIKGDRTQIEQVLLNMFLNAAHAMTIMRADNSDWGGQLYIHIEKSMNDEEFIKINPEVKNKYYWKIAIHDTGIGISDEDQSKIFEPYYSTKEIDQGTGLGLFISYNIINQLGGFISLKSELNKGSTFSIYLPVLMEEYKGNNTKRENKNISHTKKVILVVDDEEILRQSTSLVLENLGHTVLLAENGRKAIELVRYNKIDVILMDISMPEMSGNIVFKEIKKIDSEMNIIVCSGYKHDERINELFKLGLKYFLQKPYRAKELIETLNKVFNEK